MRRDPWKATLAAVAGLVLLACGGGAVTNSGSASTVPGQPAAPEARPGAADVTITACTFPANEFMGPEAAVKIVNGSSKPSNYLVQVAFVSKDGATQYDTGSVAVNGLAPGQTAEQKASSFDSSVRQKAKAGLSCKLLDVTRFAA